jgi:hypothetical protein
MKYRYLLICLCLVAGSKTHSQEIIATGQMPSVVNDDKGIYLVYGNEDSIFYSSSFDEGKSFSTPKLIDILPGLAASHMRGPQIGVTKNGLLITACNNAGNIYSFVLDKNGKVIRQTQVNDADTVAKENLMGLSSEGNNAFAVWLDLRNGRNEIYGAGSSDGGRTWSKNIRVYRSPDSTVCEYCKPSVVLKGSNVYVMFRNWINGNRDLYLIASNDSGKSFGNAQKLGYGSWALKGCPMDGGGLTVDNHVVNTVWNRDGKIYADSPGDPEMKIGEGRSCTVTSLNGKKAYAWVENKQVIFLDNNNIKRTLGKGQLPVLKAIDNNTAICIWENDKTILKTIVKI